MATVQPTNNQVPEGVMEMCMELVMKKVPVDGAMQSMLILVDAFKKAKTDEERISVLAAHFYGILSFGFYLGMDDTLNVLTELAEEWDKEGRPQDFLKNKMSQKNIYNSIFGVN